MGKYDEVMYDYLSEEERFADLFNAGCFQGRQMVDARQLERLDGRIQMQMPLVKKGGSRRGRKRSRKSIYRDIRMRLPDGTRFIILAVENQTMVDYEMPWRIMRYDCAEYENQIKVICRQKREKRRQRAIAGKCQTDLKLLLDVLRLRGDRKSMRELLQSEAYDNLDRDTAEAIAVMTNMQGIAEHIEEYKNNNGGGYSMCVAMEGIKEDARQEGISQGISQNLIKNIESAMKNFKVDLQTACRGLDTTVEEYEQAKKLLKQAEEGKR